MKRLFKGTILGSMANRESDEFFAQANERVDVKPDGLRWFCGMHDLQSTFICQAL